MGLALSAAAARLFIAVTVILYPILSLFPSAPLSYSNHQNWRHTAGRGAFSAAEAPKTQEALMAFKFLGQRQLGKLPSRWVSTILMVAIGTGWPSLGRFPFATSAGLEPVLGGAVPSPYRRKGRMLAGFLQYHTKVYRMFTNRRSAGGCRWPRRYRLPNSTPKGAFPHGSGSVPLSPIRLL